MYDVHDWAEVHRLFERERLSKSAIAKRLGMSRPTVIRLLGLDEPPRYQRVSPGSKLDVYKHAIAAMLDADPGVPATVILGRLRRDGYGGGITILKEHVAAVRPAFLAARSYQRTALLHLVDGRHADAAPPSRASDRQCQLAECHCHTPGDRLVDREFVVSAS